MLRQDLVLCKTKALLHEFLAPVCDALDKPRKRFLRQSIKGILLSGSLVVTELARLIHDDCSDSFFRVKRLLHHLANPKVHLDQAIDAYRKQFVPMIEADTPIIIDMTDIAKPRARRMEYLAYVRDASEHKLVPGYWCLEVYAHLNNKCVVPLTLDVFSIEDPAIGSQNLQIDRTVTEIHQTLDGHGVWVADRGFDGLEAYQTWFSLHAHFVVRQRGDRMVVTADGIHTIESDLVEHLRHQASLAGRATDLVYTKVHLPHETHDLYLLARWIPGHETPLIVLTTLMVATRGQAHRILRYYYQRWACEEAVQFLKGRIGFECFRVRRYVAIQRLACLAMMAMGFLSWILIRSQYVVKGLFQSTSRFRKQCPFVYYRLLDGLQTLTRYHLLCFIDKNGTIRNG